MPKYYVILITKVYHLFGFEGGCIISDYFLWETKMRQNISLQKMNNDSVCSLSHGDGLNSLFKVFDGSKYPLMLS